MESKYCWKCGAELVEGAGFCMVCGEPVADVMLGANAGEDLAEPNERQAGLRDAPFQDATGASPALEWEEQDGLTEQMWEVPADDLAQAWQEADVPPTQEWEAPAAYPAERPTSAESRPARRVPVGAKVGIAVAAVAAVAAVGYFVVWPRLAPVLQEEAEDLATVSAVEDDEPSSPSEEPLAVEDGPTNQDSSDEASEQQDLASSSSSSGDSASAGAQAVEQLSFAGITGATASSSYSDSSHYGSDYGYGPENVLDGELESAWVEGAPGWGEGESITLYGPRQRISGFTIYSGYQKYGSRGDLYYINARPATITVIANGAVVCTQTLADSGHVGQDVVFPSPVDTDSITIRIDSVYYGNSDDPNEQDCCISEIECF